MKDYDKDGYYEIMYKNNLIGIELQRFLGWVDIDGDNVAEIIDKDPYGGWIDFSKEILAVGYTEQVSAKYYDKLSFVPIEEIQIKDCKFERIKLENNVEGIVPLECGLFNSEIVNLYVGVKYNWEVNQSSYGNLFLARLN